MANVVIFNSVLGLRKGIIAAEMLRENGLNIFTPDLHEGETFDDMEMPNRRFQDIGITEMIFHTMSSIKDFPNEAVFAGFSNGATSVQLLLEPIGFPPAKTYQKALFEAGMVPLFAEYFVSSMPGMGKL